MARLLIGATASAPAERRQWVKRIASWQLDPQSFISLRRRLASMLGA
jgi:hypothetical protein